MTRRLAILAFEFFVVLILILSAGLFWASYYIDTEEFRTTFISILETSLNRDVIQVGELDIAIWPKLALKVSGLDIDDAPGFGDEPAAHFDVVSIKIRVLPLFASQIEVESVVVDGLRAVIIQSAEGRINWGTVADNEAESSSSATLSGWDLSVNSVEIVDADILLKDEIAETEYKLSGINLRTGRIRPGEDVPFSVSSGFSWAEKGIASDLVFQGVVRLSSDGRKPIFRDTTIQASFFGDFLPEGVAPGELIARVDMDWDKHVVALNDCEARFFGLRAEGDLLSGDLSEGLDISGHVTVHPFSPATLLGQHAPQLPVQDVTGLDSSAFASFIRVTEEGIRFENLVFTLDDITVRGQLGFKGYRDPVFDFSLRGNTIDLDRYLPLFRTGTPFVWDDFNLEFFGAFRGKGEARADGIKVLDTLVSDIRLDLDATDYGITVDAGAIRSGMASLGGKMEIAIGSTGEGGVPTLALHASIDAESQKSGFAFLQQGPVHIGGAGSIRLETKVSEFECIPEARSIYILRHLDGRVALSLGDGKARFAKETGKKPIELTYSKADMEVKVSPSGGNSDQFWKCNLDASIKTRGGVRIEALNGTASGPFVTAIDAIHLKSPGLAVAGHVSSPLLPNDAKRAAFSGLVGFDSKTATVNIADGVVTVLETPIQGHIQLTNLDKNIEAFGQIVIPKADPKRIIYLLTGKSIATEDGEALKSASVDSHFRADENGFTLSQFKGELDGMPIKGHAVGRGYLQPMLAFSLAAGSFNLDRYLPPRKVQSLEDRRLAKYPESDPVDLPLKFLRFLKLNGKASFNEFTLAKIRTESLSGFVKANEGIIHLSKISGNLHEGQLKADLKGETGMRSLSTHLTLDVDNMKAGPLMAEMAKREYVRGETDIKLNLRSKGRTDDDILANLSGKASVRVVNGSFKFTGYGASKQITKTSRSSQIGQSNVPRREARTVFQKVIADFTVNKGIFDLDKFRVEAPPVLQTYGKGNFSLPENRINISIRNDFVAVPSVTLRLTGKLTDPKVDVPTGKIVNDTVFNILSLPQKSFEFLRDLF